MNLNENCAAAQQIDSQKQNKKSNWPAADNNIITSICCAHTHTKQYRFSYATHKQHFMIYGDFIHIPV